MKKVIIALVFLFAGCLTYAQKKTVKATAKTTDTAKTVSKTKTATVLKKDGTPDMRVKENKMKVKTATVGPLKKDSTPDMRYKANKKKK